MNNNAHLPPAKIKYDPKKRAREECDLKAVGVKDEEPRVCSDCGAPKLASYFDSEVDGMCSECRRTKSERDLQEIKKKELTKVTNLLSGPALMEATAFRLDHIEHFLAELMENFGGTRIFAKQWYEHLQIAMHDRPGSRMVLDQMRAIAKLVMETNKLQHQESLADMSDQQLKMKKEMLILDVMSGVMSDPGKLQMLIETARVAGLGGSKPPLIEMAEEPDGDGSS